MGKLDKSARQICRRHRGRPPVLQQFGYIQDNTRRFDAIAGRSAKVIEEVSHAAVSIAATMK